MGRGLRSIGIKKLSPGQIDFTKIVSGSAAGPGSFVALSSDGTPVLVDLSSYIVAASGDITGVTAGNGLTGGGDSDAVTLAVGSGTGINVNANDIEVDADGATLTTSNSDVDHILINDGGVFKRITKGNINVGDFNNDAGYTTNTGDITGVTAGDGLTGGGSSGGVTLTVGQGTGVTVNANDIAIGQAVGTSDDVTFSTVTVESDIIHSGDTNNKISFGTDTQTFTTAGTSRIVIASDGKVGIGTTDPKQNFVVMADDAAIRIANNVDGDGDNFSGRLEIAEDSDANGVMSHGGFVLFDGDAASGLGAGQMRIGVRNNSSTDVPLISIDRDATSANAIHIAPEGVGIGRTPTTYHFEVEGDIYASDDIVVTDDIFLGDKIIHLNDTNNHIAFGTDTQTFTTAGATAMKINANGIVTKPLQPCFRVIKTSTQLNIDTDVYVTISFDTESFDLNNDFDLSTEKFTVPVNGVYLFGVVLDFDSLSNKQDYREVSVHAQVTKSSDSSTVRYIMDQKDPNEYGGPQEKFSLSGTTLAQLESGDTVHLSVYIADEDTDDADDADIGISTRFWGTLIN
jgi:hypothetical protein